MLWWIVGGGLVIVVVAAFYMQRLYLRPWQELEHLLTRIGRGEQPPTFLLGGTAQTRRVGVALEQLLLRQRELDRQVSKDVATATYWLIGRHIVEFGQSGKSKAEYGEEVIDQLAFDLTARFERRFTRSNLFNMRAFYVANPRIVRTVSGQLQPPAKIQTASGKSPSPQPILSTPSIELAGRKGQTSSDQCAVARSARSGSQLFPQLLYSVVRSLVVRSCFSLPSFHL